MSIFDRIFSKKKTAYADQKESLRSAKTKERMSLAKNTETNKEILYYLAEQDPDPAVRKAVAENKSMPPQVSPVLANDSDEDVRFALARRLTDLLPDISQSEQSQLYAFVVQALGTLALDEVLKIRKALSSTLKDHAFTPPKVAGQLARDVEREVSEPILRFCAALPDDDLLSILKGHPASWVIEAIAGRNMVSAEVSEAVIETADPAGGGKLIDNEGADLPSTLLQTIVEKAKEFPEWQRPMATRKSIPVSILKELAAFVDASVRDLLMSRGDFDEQTTEEIAAVFRRRVDFVTDEEVSERPLKERLQAMIDENSLSEDTLSDAIAMRDYDFVCAALGHFVKTDAESVRKIMDMKAPKAIVALSWYAGLSMRMALQIQREVAQVPPKELLYPRDGTDYPLSESDLNWQLEFLGLKAA